MGHDEIVYPNPDAFRPERHFNETGNLNEDDLAIAYGFGKRWVSESYEQDKVTNFT
jgi:cytochrome P450